MYLSVINMHPQIKTKGDIVMSKSRPLNERIESAKEEIKQKENRLKELLQKQKARERIDRNHRLCERCAYLESILPDTIPLTYEQFQTYLNKTLLTDFANRILWGLTVENVAAASTTNPDSGNIAPKPAETAHSVATPVSAGVTTTQRQAS